MQTAPSKRHEPAAQALRQEMDELLGGALASVRACQVAMTRKCPFDREKRRKYRAQVRNRWCICGRPRGFMRRFHL